MNICNVKPLLQKYLEFCLIGKGWNRLDRSNLRMLNKPMAMGRQAVQRPVIFSGSELPELSMNSRDA